MKLLFSILLSACATLAVGQQPATPPAAPPSATQSPRAQFPPDTTAPAQPTAPAPGQVSSQDIQDELQKEFGRASILSDQQLKATVDDQSILLTGTVESTQQHDLALQLAQQYAGARKIVDKIEIRQKT